MEEGLITYVPEDWDDGMEEGLITYVPEGWDDAPPPSRAFTLDTNAVYVAPSTDMYFQSLRTRNLFWDDLISALRDLYGSFDSKFVSLWPSLRVQLTYVNSHWLDRRRGLGLEASMSLLPRDNNLRFRSYSDRAILYFIEHLNRIFPQHCYVKGQDKKYTRILVNPPFEEREDDYSYVLDPASAGRLARRHIVKFNFADQDKPAVFEAFLHLLEYEKGLMTSVSANVWMRLQFGFLRYNDYLVRISRRLENREALSDKLHRKASLDLHLFDSNANTWKMLPNVHAWSNILSFLGTKSETPLLHMGRPLPPSLEDDFETRASRMKSVRGSPLAEMTVPRHSLSGNLHGAAFKPDTDTDDDDEMDSKRKGGRKKTIRKNSSKSKRQSKRSVSAKRSSKKNI